MKIQRLDDQSLMLEEIDDFCGELLQQIPASADPTGSAAAEARIFPRPTGGREAAADEDWAEYVQPELRARFRESTAVVEDDLRQLTSAKPAPHCLCVPGKNLEAWVHALNQARLTLAARHRFTDEEIDRPMRLDAGPRATALFQLHFYGLLQEFFLRHLD